MLALTALAACSPGETTQASRSLSLPSCWAFGMFKPNDLVTGVGRAFYSPDGPLLISSLDCETMRFEPTFSNKAVERAVFQEMGAQSTGDAWGGQWYIVWLQGEVSGDGKDRVPLAVDELRILRRLPQVEAQKIWEFDPKAKAAFAE